jgi:hypothetical protein
MRIESSYRVRHLPSKANKETRTMSIIQVGIVDTTGKLDPSLVEAAAASLNVQVLRDLTQFWNVQATVRFLPDKDKVPVGVWPVLLVAKLPPGEGGFHFTKKNQPFAKVIGTPSDSNWTIDASHEVLEMLVDPSGNRLQASRAIQISGKDVVDAEGEFEYLVEACDPCEDNRYAYSINGIAVSDFITPRFYDPVATSSARYSFGGNIERPRQILPGGYISYTNPQTEDMEQILFLGAKPVYNNLGPATGSNLRSFVDSHTYGMTQKVRKANNSLAKHCSAHRKLVESAALASRKAY